MGVQQKLMRHAHVSTTMDQCGNASALAKRKANRPIVQRLLRRSATQQVSIQPKLSNKVNCLRKLQGIRGSIRL